MTGCGGDRRLPRRIPRHPAQAQPGRLDAKCSSDRTLFGLCQSQGSTHEGNGSTLGARDQRLALAASVVAEFSSAQTARADPGQ